MIRVKPIVTEKVTEKPHVTEKRLMTVTEIRQALRGRPRKPNALSNAERQRMFRLRKKTDG